MSDSWTLEDVGIRDAVPADAPVIAAIHVASWRAAYGGFMPEEVMARLSVARRTAEWRGRIESGATVLIAHRGAEATGFAALSPDGGELTALYLDPPVYGRGVGGLLLAAVRARAAGPRLVLWVFAGNRGAIRFYERHGFVADGAVEEPMRGVAALRMSAAL